MAIENVARVAFRKCFISFATCSFNIFTRESFVFVSFQIRDLVELLERKLQKDSEWKVKLLERKLQKDSEWKVELLERKLQKDSEWKVELSAHCSPDKLYILYE